MSASDSQCYELHGLQPVLAVEDITASAVYYCDVLGFNLDFVYGDTSTHARVSGGDSSAVNAVRFRFKPVGSSLIPQGSMLNIESVKHIGIRVTNKTTLQLRSQKTSI